MKYTIYSLTLLYYLPLILASPQIDTDCPIGDSSCLVAPDQAIATFIATSLPQLGREKLDPMFIDSVPIVDTCLRFFMRNLRVDGLKNLVVDDVSVDASSKVIRMQFHSDFVKYMLYTTNGTLLSVPFYGEGNYTVKFESVLLDMEIPYNVITDANGRDNIDLKSYQYTYDVRDGAQFDFENLYYGDMCIVSDKMHRSLNKNWKYVVGKYAGYVFDKVTDQLFNSLRSVVGSTPLDTIV